MFDTKAVFKIAMEMGFNELANFISTDTKRYANLILTGELENVEWRNYADAEASFIVRFFRRPVLFQDQAVLNGPDSAVL